MTFHQNSPLVAQDRGKKFKTNNSRNRHKKLVCSKEIILKLNVMGKEERMKMVLAISRKRADILNHLNWNFI